jgi:hypothetical protein
MGQIITFGISGTQDGVHTTFILSQAPQHLFLFNNGLFQYPALAYTLTGTEITFLPGYIPQPGDQLHAEGTAQTDTGDAIQVLSLSGVQDGTNAYFTLSQNPEHLYFFNNGLFQYPGVAYTRSGSAITFLPDYIPQPEDVLRAEGIV